MIALTLLVLAACDQEKTNPSTDGVPAEIPWLESGNPAVAPPEIDWLDAGTPDIAPPNRSCPTGWTEEPLELGGHMCSPWPTGVHEECTETSMQLPGAEGCTEVGSDCPTDTWPSDATDEDTWFVASGSDGAGSREAPFGTIAEAVAAASDGDTILVAAGTYDEPVRLVSDVTLRGVCVAEVRITGSLVSDEEDGVVVVDNAEVTLRDLSIADATAVGVLTSGGSVTLSGVVIDGVANHGINAADTELTLSDVLISNVDPRPSDSANGDGLYQVGGSLTATGVGITATHRTAMWVEGAPFTVSDYVAWAIRSEVSTGTRGAGFRQAVLNGSESGTLSRVAVEDAQSYAIALQGEVHTVLEDIWVRDIGNDDTGSAFGGIGTQGSGQLDIFGATVLNVAGPAIRSYTVDGTAAASTTIQDAVVDSPFSMQAITAGDVPSLTVERVFTTNSYWGIYALGGTAASVSDFVGVNHGIGGVFIGIPTTFDRVLINGATYYGLAIDSSDFVMNDVAIRNVADEAGGSMAMGISLSSAGLEASRLLVDTTTARGISLVAPTSVSLTDVVVTDTAGTPYGGGQPIYARGWDYAPISITRASIVGGVTAGLELELVTATLQDVAVDGIGSDPSGLYGYGLSARYADITVANSTFTGVQYAGIMASTASLALTDVAVHDVTAQACATDGCPDDGAATGIYVTTDTGTDGAASLDRVLVDAAVGAGLQSDGAAVQATDLVVSNSGVGIDAVSGAVTEDGVTLDGNTLDGAAGVGPFPGLLWGTVVPNDGSWSGDAPIEEGEYDETIDAGDDTCGGMIAMPEQTWDLVWQGANELTLTAPYSALPQACLYDGTAFECVSSQSVWWEYSATATIELGVTWTLSAETPTSFGAEVTSTLTCAGDDCTTAATDLGVDLPCSYAQQSAFEPR
jgi:Protein of unknown function (DUF1565)